MKKPRAKTDLTEVPTVRDVQTALRALGNAEKAKGVARFFKSGPGEYGEGDRFIGVTVPEQRTVARSFSALPLEGVATLLASPIHEDRLTALLIMERRFSRGDDVEREACVALFLKHLAHVNNWDLVDSSAHQILGQHLIARDRTLLHRFAKSKSLWERRVAIVSTYAFIREGESKETFAIAELLLNDEHDLIHKAVGWMLREVGKHVSEGELRGFLKKNAARMPRTMLRYAIERMSEAERAQWRAA